MSNVLLFFRILQRNIEKNVLFNFFSVPYFTLNCIFFYLDSYKNLVKGTLGMYWKPIGKSRGNILKHMYSHCYHLEKKWKNYKSPT